MENKEFEPLSDPAISKLTTITDMKTTIVKLNNDVKLLTEFSKPQIRYLIKSILFDQRMIGRYNRLRKMAIDDRKGFLKIIKDLESKLEKKKKEIEKLTKWKKRKGKDLKTWVKKRRENELSRNN